MGNRHVKLFLFALGIQVASSFIGAAIPIPTVQSLLGNLF